LQSGAPLVCDRLKSPVLRPTGVYDRSLSGNVKYFTLSKDLGIRCAGDDDRRVIN
jgi:hypothetical protein